MYYFETARTFPETVLNYLLILRKIENKKNAYSHNVVFSLIVYQIMVQYLLEGTN